jgi:hypothetical protein
MAGDHGTSKCAACWLATLICKLERPAWVRFGCTR